MKEESFKDLVTILERVFVVVDREGGWTPARIAETTTRIGKLKLNRGERLALYPKMEEAGIKGDTAQAKTLGVDRTTVARDKGKKSVASATDSKVKSVASATAPSKSSSVGEKGEDKPKPPGGRQLVDAVQVFYNVVRTTPLEAVVEWQGDDGRLLMWWESISKYMEQVLEGRNL